MADVAKIPLPWSHDPAFLAWIDQSLLTLGTAFGVSQTGALPQIPTLTVLLGALILVGFNGLAMLRHVFLSGPDLFQDAPAPDPAVALAALRAEFDAYRTAHP